MLYVLVPIAWFIDKATFFSFHLLALLYLLAQSDDICDANIQIKYRKNLIDLSIALSFRGLFRLATHPLSPLPTALIDLLMLNYK